VGGRVFKGEEFCFGSTAALAIGPICKRISSRLALLRLQFKSHQFATSKHFPRWKVVSCLECGVVVLFFKTLQQLLDFPEVAQKFRHMSVGASSGAQRKHFNKFIDSLRALQLISPLLNVQ